MNFQPPLAAYLASYGCRAKFSLKMSREIGEDEAKQEFACLVFKRSYVQFLVLPNKQAHKQADRKETGMPSTLSKSK